MDKGKAEKKNCWLSDSYIQSWRLTRARAQLSKQNTNNNSWQTFSPLDQISVAVAQQVVSHATIARFFPSSIICCYVFKHGGRQRSLSTVVERSRAHPPTHVPHIPPPQNPPPVLVTYNVSIRSPKRPWRESVEMWRDEQRRRRQTKRKCREKNRWSARLANRNEVFSVPWHT